MLQRRQDIISEGDCKGEYDNDRVHKGLVFVTDISDTLVWMATLGIVYYYCSKVAPWQESRKHYTRKR